MQARYGLNSGAARDPPIQFHVGFWGKGTLTIADGGKVQTGFTTPGT
ncbi:hypothetical protein [Manganibacter manganicus]|nr:hypothetical protein [Pseudaminobacter manganicus]